MRRGWRLHFGWERAEVGDQPRRRIPWAAVIVTLALIAGGLSIASYLVEPSAQVPAPVAHYTPIVTLSPRPSPSAQVIQVNGERGAICVVPTSAVKRTTIVTVRVP